MQWWYLIAPVPFLPSCARNPSLMFTLAVCSGHSHKKLVKWQYFEYEHYKNKWHLCYVCVLWKERGTEHICVGCAEDRERTLKPSELACTAFKTFFSQLWVILIFFSRAGMESSYLTGHCFLSLNHHKLGNRSGDSSFQCEPIKM